MNRRETLPSSDMRPMRDMLVPWAIGSALLAVAAWFLFHSPTVDVLRGKISLVLFDSPPVARQGPMQHASTMLSHGMDDRESFCLVVHPFLESRRELWPLRIAYHVPPSNYGDTAAPKDCEHFGAALLGEDVETYYSILYEAADTVRPPQDSLGSLS